MLKFLLILLLLANSIIHSKAQVFSDGENELDIQEIILNYYKNQIPSFKILYYSKEYNLRFESQFSIISDTLYCYNNEDSQLKYTIKNNEFNYISENTTARLNYIFTLEYDSSDYKVNNKYQIKGNDTVLSSKVLYKLDSLNRVIEEIFFNYTKTSNGLVYKCVFEYGNNYVKKETFKLMTDEWIVERIYIDKTFIDTIYKPYKMQVISNSIYTEIDNKYSESPIILYQNKVVRTIKYNRKGLIKMIITNTEINYFFKRDKALNSSNKEVTEVKIL